MVQSLTRELHSEDGRDHEKTGKKASHGFGGGSGMVQSRAGLEGVLLSEACSDIVPKFFTSGHVITP